jgi:hypothetical protein
MRGKKGGRVADYDGEMRKRDELEEFLGNEAYELREHSKEL